MTKLTGRHMEFELFTLSFDEYLGMKGFLGKPVSERRAEFEEYLRYGGFPVRSLENVLYVYLRSCGYRVSVGRIGKLECNLICRRRDDYSYVQVAMTIADRAVEDREYRPFTYIRDNYPQYLFTLDPLLQRRDGVRHLNLADFMAEEGELLTP